MEKSSNFKKHYPFIIWPLLVTGILMSTPSATNFIKDKVNYNLTLRSRSEFFKTEARFMSQVIFKLDIENDLQKKGQHLVIEKLISAQRAFQPLSKIKSESWNQSKEEYLFLKNKVMEILEENL